MPDKDVEAMSGKTDERNQGDWQSRYDNTAQKIQRREAGYLLFLFIVSFVLILLNYLELPSAFLKISDDKSIVFSRMFSCTICGLLGGTIFNMKWFYKSIAHGYWNLDRKYWRYFMPFISLGIAFCLACIFSENIIIYGSGFTASTLGFLVGYFSDEAVGKMAEVAKVLFNTDKKVAGDSGDKE